MQGTSFEGKENASSGHFNISFATRNAFMAAVEGVPFGGPKWLLGPYHIDH